MIGIEYCGLNIKVASEDNHSFMKLYSHRKDTKGHSEDGWLRGNLDHLLLNIQPPKKALVISAKCFVTSLQHGFFFGVPQDLGLVF